MPQRAEPGSRVAATPSGGHIPVSETTHAALRRETASWHRAVEDGFAGLDLQRRDDLAVFLQAQATVVFAIERELDEGGIGHLVFDWPARRRSDALESDLLLLGLTPPVPDAWSSPIEDLGRQLGYLYVLEGSRLGGRLLARQVAASADPVASRATAFLRHAVEPGAWAGFLAILDATPAPRADILDGAVEAFRRYHSAAVAVKGLRVPRLNDEVLVRRPGA